MSRRARGQGAVQLHYIHRAERARARFARGLILSRRARAGLGRDAAVEREKRKSRGAAYTVRVENRGTARRRDFLRLIFPMVMRLQGVGWSAEGWFEFQNSRARLLGCVWSVLKLSWWFCCGTVCSCGCEEIREAGF